MVVAGSVSRRNSMSVGPKNAPSCSEENASPRYVLQRTPAQHVRSSRTVSTRSPIPDLEQPINVARASLSGLARVVLLSEPRCWWAFCTPRGVHDGHPLAITAYTDGRARLAAAGCRYAQGVSVMDTPWYLSTAFAGDQTHSSSRSVIQRSGEARWVGAWCRGIASFVLLVREALRDDRRLARTASAPGSPQRRRALPRRAWRSSPSRGPRRGGPSRCRPFVCGQRRRKESRAASWAWVSKSAETMATSSATSWYKSRSSGPASGEAALSSFSAACPRATNAGWGAR
jgi:hypothetical protein